MDKVKLWGGTHKNELLTRGIIDYFKQSQIAGVYPEIADTISPWGEREPNMNDAYGDPDHPKAERAKEVLEINRSFKYVLDVHGTLPGGVDHAWLNGEQLNSELLPSFLGLLALFDIEVIIDGRALDNMLKYSANALTLEVKPRGRMANPKFWIAPLTKLAKGTIEPAPLESFACYRFAGNVTREQGTRLGLPRGLARFDPILNSTLAEELGCPGEQLHALGWMSDHQDWCGEVAYKIEPSRLLERRGIKLL